MELIYLTISNAFMKAFKFHKEGVSPNIVLCAEVYKILIDLISQSLYDRLTNSQFVFCSQRAASALDLISKTFNLIFKL